jgi:hypothetical protein
MEDSGQRDEKKEGAANILYVLREFLSRVVVARVFFFRGTAGVALLAAGIVVYL